MTPPLTRRQFLAATLASAAAANASRAWAADAPAPTSVIPGFHFTEQEGGRLLLTENGKPVLTYNFGDQLKEGVPPDRKRSCYVHPVWGLDGEVLTDDFPKDHYHHRGLAWMWQRIRVDGKEAAIWAIKGVRQHFVKWLDRKADAGAATFAVENQWIMDDKKKVAKETVRLTVHKTEAAGRAIDAEITLESLGPTITVLGEPTKGYGGFCVRFAPRTETVMTTEKGVVPKDTDLERVPWADLSAKFEGRPTPSGIAIFVNASNPLAPNTWTLRDYGFLGPCWPGLETATLEPGKPVTFKYRVWVHRGDAAAGGVKEAFEAFRKV